MFVFSYSEIKYRVQYDQYYDLTSSLLDPFKALYGHIWTAGYQQEDILIHIHLRNHCVHIRLPEKIRMTKTTLIILSYLYR